MTIRTWQEEREPNEREPKTIHRDRDNHTLKSTPDRRRCHLWMLVGCLLLAMPSRAQEKLPAEPILMDDLPSPPKELADLIKKGAVEFCTGRVSWSEMSQAQERPTVAGPHLRLAAETKAEMRFDYRSRTRWKQRSENKKTILSVTVRFSNDELTAKHTIWFRHPPSAERFWDDKIVQHEFDHVRLSMHPMINQLFKQKIKAATAFRYELKDDERVSEALVNRLVQQRVRAAIAEISDLIDIRYKELDRVSRHGLQPIPDDSDVVKWLKHER